MCSLSLDTGTQQYTHYKARVHRLPICNLLKTCSGNYIFNYYIICKDNNHHKNYLQPQNVQNISVQLIRNQTATQISHGVNLFITHLK